MNCDNNQNNNGCGCNCNPNPTPAPAPADISMSVCDRNINMLPMLQTYTTKVLKPNIEGCCRKNILTQQMMNCEGYKYVIKWDFDLDGKTITVPSNCILEFDGGSLKNGTIVGQDTVFINVGDVNIWGDNLTREGTWREKQGGNGGIPDKEYDPEHHSGLGRKTLELDGDSNILTQDDFDQENTIYVITHDFDLNGGTIEIPEGCILDFEGGSISSSEEGGKLIGDNTAIEAPIAKIFDTSIEFDGRWAVDQVYTEWFGAVTDNENIDSTPAIQAAIGFAGNSYGKVVKFLQGYYYFSTITPKHKVSLVGSGIGCTMLKQMTGETGHGIVIDTYYSCMKLEDFTIIGTRAETGNGIHIPDPGIDQTSSRDHPIMEVKGEEHNGARYKYAYINNIAVFRFGKGIYTASNVYCVFITNCYFTDNLNDGAEIHMTDSTIDNCYLENNGGAGINIFGGNNKVSRIKSIWNGKTNPDNDAAIGIHANRITLTDCETQDNYCRGYYINGRDCMISNCLSNTDGYGNSIVSEQKDYMFVPGAHAIGFNIGTNIVGTTFKNCKVTNYRVGGFPATYGEPFTFPNRRIPDSEVPSQYIPELSNLENIYDEINVTAMGGFSMFRTYHFTADDSIPTHAILGEYNKLVVNGYTYVEPTNYAHIDVSDRSIVLKNGVTIFISFRIKDVTNTENQYKDFINIYTKDDALKLQAEVLQDKHRLFFNSAAANRSNHFAEIPNSYHPDGNMSDFITVAITCKNNNVYTRGYFSRIEAAVTDKQEESAENCKKEVVFIESGTASFYSGNAPIQHIKFGNDILLDKFFITNEYISDNYLIPGAPTSKYRNGSLAYIASNNLQEVFRKSGTSENRPELGGANNGFLYYDETLGKLIVWWGNGWHNVDGTNIIEG